MCKLFEMYKKEIERYCNENGLSYLKVQSMSQCWGKNDIWLQYVDEEKGSKGLLDETPAPIVLKIVINNGKVYFEQTPYTKKYLV